MKQWLLTHITLRPDDPPAEERASGLTHLVGAILSVIGTAFLLLRMLREGERSDVLASAVFGLSMIVLYSSSAAYHLSHDPVRRRFFRVMDHVAIFLLIAGTYTPLALGIGGRVGWSMFAAIWTVASLGITFTFVFWGRLRWLHVIVYVATGWTVVLFWEPVMATVPRELFGWTLAGGLVYTVGAVVYAVKRLPYHHALWHLFVLAGSTCFYVGMYRCVLQL
ncbi:MAG: hemolysin III family protein [Pseudomonadota bacterium]